LVVVLSQRGPPIAYSRDERLHDFIWERGLFAGAEARAADESVLPFEDNEQTLFAFHYCSIGQLGEEPVKFSG
jgi:hypothetical protein